MSELKTICVECRFHEGQADGPRTDCWYNHFCIHPEVERVPDIDPVTGKAGFAAANSLGMGYLTDKKHPNCRDINHGNCPHFVKSGILGRVLG